MGNPSRRTVRMPVREIDPRLMATGLLTVGSPRTGKSIFLKRLRGDAIARHDPMVVLDLSGGDELESVEWQAAKYGVPEVAIFDPQMEDSWTWDFPDLTATDAARWHVSGKVFPDIKGDQSPFFNLNARDVYFTDLCVLNHFGGDYTFADSIRLAFNLGLLGRLADLVPHLGDPVRRFGDTKSAHDIMSTVRMRLAPLRPMAALLEKATRKIDLFNLRCPLVLVGRDRDAAVWSKLFSLVLDLMADERLEAPRPDPLWFFLDEFRQLEELRALSPLLRRAGKTNTIVAASLHSVNGMYARYGEHEGKEILNLFGRKVFFQTGCPDTARWAADHCGGVDSITDIEPPPGGNNVHREHKDRFNVSPEEFRRIPLPDARRDLLKGVYDGPDGTFWFEIPWLKEVTPPFGWKPRRRKRRPPQDEILYPFTERDFERLKFPNDPALLEFLK